MWNLIANAVASLGIAALLLWVWTFARRFGSLETTIKMGFDKNEEDHSVTNRRIESLKDSMRDVEHNLHKLEVQVAALAVQAGVAQRVLDK
jgi:NADH/NAD ratio-sensing transcriptional regulator Rex